VIIFHLMLFGMDEVPALLQEASKK
jgi:hypothetical protein